MTHVKQSKGTLKLPTIVGGLCLASALATGCSVLFPRSDAGPYNPMTWPSTALSAIQYKYKSPGPARSIYFDEEIDEAARSQSETTEWVECKFNPSCNILLFTWSNNGPMIIETIGQH